jgi:hypothetical protein
MTFQLAPHGIEGITNGDVRILVGVIPFRGATCYQLAIGQLHLD